MDRVLKVILSILVVVFLIGCWKYENIDKSLLDEKKQNIQLTQQVKKLQTQFDGLKQLEDKLIQLQDEVKKFEPIKLENKKLKDTVDMLVKENNELMKTVTTAAQTGTSKPIKTGITPTFTTMMSRGGNPLVETKQKLTDVAQGSYQHSSEEVQVSVEDRKSWQYAGNWYVSRYTATVDECDNNPSITADGKLVTPGFTVAVDPKFWKYGTIFYFEGLGYGVAADSGGQIKGKNRADFLVASKKFATELSNYRDVWIVYTPTS